MVKASNGPRPTPGQRSNHLAKTAPGCYSQLASEIVTAKRLCRSPKDVWSSLFGILVKNNLSKRNALMLVIDLFTVAGPDEASFFVGLLEDYVDEDSSQGSNSDGDRGQYQGDDEAAVLSHTGHNGGTLAQRMDDVNVDAARSDNMDGDDNSEVQVMHAHDEDGEDDLEVYEVVASDSSLPKKDRASRSTQSPRTREIGLCLRKMSHVIRCGNMSRSQVERFCKAIAILIREYIVTLDEVWPYMGNDDFLGQCDSTYEESIEKHIQKLEAKLDPKEAQAPEDMGPMSLFSETVTLQSTYDTKQDLWAPLHIWILASLLAEDRLQDVAPYLAKHKNLVRAYPVLRSSLTRRLRANFESAPKEDKLYRVLHAAHTLGPHFGQDYMFFTEVCELCSTEYATDKSLVLDVLRKAILPALSLYKYNESAADVVWSILAKFDQGVRFELYAEWCNVLYDQEPVLKVPQRLAKHEANILLQRISKKNIDTVGKYLGRLASTNPLLIWKNILSYAQNFSEMIPTIVAVAVSYSGPFAQDALLSIILNEIERDEHRLFKRDDNSFEYGFACLSLLTGAVFTYSANLQGSSLVMYLETLLERFSKRAVYIQLLSDLLTCMSGIKPLSESDAHVKALAGSSLLRKVVFRFTALNIAETVTCEERIGNKCLPNYVVGNARSPNEGFSPILVSLFSGPRFRNVMMKLLTMLALDISIHEVSSTSSSPWFYVWDRKLLLLKQTLEILKLGHYDTQDFLVELSENLEPQVTRSVRMAIVRPSLRSQIESHSLEFSSDFKRLASIPNGVDPEVYALFWALEAYDIYVPEAEYSLEISLTHNKSSMNVGQASIASSLKASRAEHRDHVSWVLSILPKLETSNPDFLLRDIILPRAAWSRTDAHYVFCFLTHTLVNPLPLLDALFHQDMLLKQISDCSGEQISALAYLFNEIWRDLNSWPRNIQSGSRDEDNVKKTCDTSDGHGTDIGPDNCHNDPDCSFQEDCIVKMELDSCGDLGSVENTSHGNHYPASVRSYEDVAIEMENNRGPNVKYTLFRAGIDVDSHIQRWGKNIFDTVSCALDNDDVAVLENALNFALRLTESIPQRHEIGCAMIDEQLKLLMDDKRRRMIAKLAKRVRQVFTKRHQMDWDGYAEWREDEANREKDPGSAQTRKKRRGE